MQSVIQTKKECYVSGAAGYLEEHHIFGGPNRKHSEKYGLKVWLSHDYHRGNYGVHSGNAELAAELHQLGQRAFETRFGMRDDFVRIFGRNYL